MRTKTGCRFDCTFCETPVLYGGGVQFRCRLESTDAIGKLTENVYRVVIPVYGHCQGICNEGIFQGCQHPVSQHVWIHGINIRGNSGLRQALRWACQCRSALASPKISSECLQRLFQRRPSVDLSFLGRLQNIRLGLPADGKTDKESNDNEEGLVSSGAPAPA